MERRNYFFGDSNYTLAREPELAELINRALVPGAQLDEFNEMELIRIQFLVRGVLQYMQAQHTLWREGALSDDYWRRRLKWTCSFVASQVLNPVWQDEIAQQLVDPNFVREVEAGMKEELLEINMGKNRNGT